MNRLLLFLLLLSTFYFNSYAQNSDELNKLLGIAPRKPESKGSSYRSIHFVYEVPTYFTSYFSENQINNTNNPEPNINFIFKGLTILTSYPSNDPKSKLSVLGEIDNNIDNELYYRRYQCIDNSGNNVALAVAFELSSKTEMILLIYKNTTYYYEVKRDSIPQKVIEIFNCSHNKEEFIETIDLPINLKEKKFLNQFGEINKVIILLCN